MKVRVSALFLATLTALFSLSLITLQSPAETAPVDLTPTVYWYLPSISRQPTPTPTATPTPMPTATPIPTPRPRLRDGYYVCDVSNYTENGRGEFWFTVDNGGTEVKDAGFLFQTHYYFCPWLGYSWWESEPVENGAFGFVEVEDRHIKASLGCHAVSSTEAWCDAFYFYTGDWPMCSSVECLAVRQ